MQKSDGISDEKKEFVDNISSSDAVAPVIVDSIDSEKLMVVGESEEKVLKKNTQARDWCFTVNNPVQTEEEFLAYFQSIWDKSHLRYVVFQRERGEETGTEHYQGYIEFVQPKWFSTVKKIFSAETIGVNAYVAAKSSKSKRWQAREYCMTEETRVSPQYYELGEFIADGERTDLTDIMADIENGASFVTLSKKHGERFAKKVSWAEKYRQAFLREKFGNMFRHVEVYYIFGRTEIGKTRSLFDKYGYSNVYLADDYNHPFDEYDGQDVLVFDEFHSSVKINQMLRYLDGYPLMLPSRYNNKTACYTKVYIVSNRALYEQYSNVQTSSYGTWRAFLRRITAVYDYNISRDEPIDKIKASLSPNSKIVEVTDDILLSEIDKYRTTKRLI